MHNCAECGEWFSLDEMLNHAKKQQIGPIIVKKILAAYNAFKDDIRQLADLKQQISQKMILLRSTVTLWRCAAK